MELVINILSVRKNCVFRDKGPMYGVEVTEQGLNQWSEGKFMWFFWYFWNLCLSCDPKVKVNINTDVNVNWQILKWLSLPSG